MKKLLYTLSLLCAALPCFSQQALKVFLSRQNMPLSIAQENDFIRNELREVAFVGGPSVCDVQVVVWEEYSILDAYRLQMAFVGHDRFAGQRDTLFFNMNSAENLLSQREKFVEMLRSGLLPFLLQTEWAEYLVFEEKKMRKRNFDGWDAPIFGVYGNGSYSKNESKSGMEGSPLETNSITERTLFSGGFSFGKINNTYRLSGGLSTAYVKDYRYMNFGGIPIEGLNTTKRHFGNLSFAYALTRHWSVGTSTFARKIDDELYNQNIGANVEYSFFPYEEWFSRQLTLRYGIGKQIFGAINQKQYAAEKWDNSLNLEYFGRTDWGYFSVQSFASYIPIRNQWDAWSYGAFSRIGLELGKGIFFNLSLSANRSNTDYSVVSGVPVYSKYHRAGSLSLYGGVSYFFGSNFRSAVNPIGYNFDSIQF